MADGTLDTVLGWLRGKPTNPSLGIETAPSLLSYPSHQDADYARNYDFGTNNLHEDYLNNNRSRVLGYSIPMTSKKDGGEIFMQTKGTGMTGSDVLDPALSKDIDLNQKTNTGIQDDLRNVHMRAALAANRSPLAAVGFDPSKVVVDSLIKNPSIAGLYKPNVDKMYTVVDPEDAIVHESTHRGLQKLREQYPDKVNPLMAKMPNEEMVVRWLMKSKAGDPEGKAGDIDAKQRQQSIDLFSDAKHQEALNALEEIAIEHMKGRGKRVGPQ